MSKKAVKITMSEELYNWFLERSNEIGVSVPALAVIACDSYKRQNNYVERDSLKKNK